MPTTDRVHILLDTNGYSGNFERQACAYGTGQLGECEVGCEEAVQARKELPADILQWWEDHIEQVADEENGCERPVAIAPTPGRLNNGCGYHYDDTPEGVRCAMEKARPKQYKAVRERLAELDCKVIGVDGWTQELHDHGRAKAESELSMLDISAAPDRFPAYESLAIYVSEVPPKAVLDSLETRVREFLALRKVTLTGVRLESFKQVVTVDTQVRRLPRP